MSKVGFLTKAINFIAENSTTLLTVGAVTGVVASSVTSWYAAKKTKDIKERLGSGSSFGDVAKESWPYYVAPGNNAAKEAFMKIVTEILY